MSKVPIDFESLIDAIDIRIAEEEDARESAEAVPFLNRTHHEWEDLFFDDVRDEYFLPPIEQVTVPVPVSVPVIDLNFELIDYWQSEWIEKKDLNTLCKYRASDFESIILDPSFSTGRGYSDRQEYGISHFDCNPIEKVNNRGDIIKGVEIRAIIKGRCLASCSESSMYGCWDDKLWLHLFENGEFVQLFPQRKIKWLKFNALPLQACYRPMRIKQVMYNRCYVDELPFKRENGEWLYIDYQNKGLHSLFSLTKDILSDWHWDLKNFECKKTTNGYSDGIELIIESTSLNLHVKIYENASGNEYHTEFIGPEPVLKIPKHWTPKYNVTLLHGFHEQTKSGKRPNMNSRSKIYAYTPFKIITEYIPEIGMHWQLEKTSGPVRYHYYLIRKAFTAKELKPENIDELEMRFKSDSGLIQYKVDVTECNITDENTHLKVILKGNKSESGDPIIISFVLFQDGEIRLIAPMSSKEQLSAISITFKTLYDPDTFYDNSVSFQSDRPQTYVRIYKRRRKWYK